MNLKLMLASATLALIAAGAAQAAPAKSTALPSQPVPYTMLDAYLKATPKARAAMLANASSQTAHTDAAANVGASGASSTSETSSDAGAAPAASETPAPAAPAPTTSSGEMPPGPVNPPSATPPATDSSSEKSTDGTAAPDKP